MLLKCKLILKQCRCQVVTKLQAKCKKSLEVFMHWGQFETLKIVLRKKYSNFFIIMEMRRICL